MDDYIALCRLCAAAALAAIGGREAERALKTAANAQLRADAKGAVDSALEQVSKKSNKRRVWLEASG